MRMLLVTYSILLALLKWRPANCAAYSFINSCVKSFFAKFSYKTSFTFQLFQLADAMGLEDESCLDKVKKCTPDQNATTRKSVLIYKKCRKTGMPSGSVFLNGLHKSPGACHVLKIDIIII